MRRSCFMKNCKPGFIVITLVFLFILPTLCSAAAQGQASIKLPAVTKDRGDSLMAALSAKASANSLSERDLSLQDLSDLLWAAAGVNRPESGKRTYSTAMNTQDVDVYVITKDGVFLYDYENHALNQIGDGDHRMVIGSSLQKGGAGGPGGAPGEAARGGEGNASGEKAGAPAAGAARKRLSTFAVDIVLVGEPSKCPAGSDELKQEWSAFSAGMIAQNIMLFCSANNMGTHPRAAFDKGVIKELLKLRDTQNPVIELPVGYLE